MLFSYLMDFIARKIGVKLSTPSHHVIDLHVGDVVNLWSQGSTTLCGEPVCPGAFVRHIIFSFQGMKTATILEIFSEETEMVKVVLTTGQIGRVPRSCVWSIISSLK